MRKLMKVYILIQNQARKCPFEKASVNVYAWPNPYDIEGQGFMYNLGI